LCEFSDQVRSGNRNSYRHAKMTRKIQDMSDQELLNLQSNYQKRGVSDGGMFSLAEVNREIYNRTPSEKNGREVADLICSLLQKSGSEHITYKDIWIEIASNAAWQGNHSARIVGNALRVCISYCVENNYPILTTLVRQGTGKITEDAIQNIYNEAKMLGVDVGLSPEKFVTQQQVTSLEFVKNKI